MLLRTVYQSGVQIFCAHHSDGVQLVKSPTTPPAGRIVRRESNDCSLTAAKVKFITSKDITLRQFDLQFKNTGGIYFT